jgi:hypothetical protein
MPAYTHATVLAAVLTASIAHPNNESCHSTHELLRHVAPLTSEYTHLIVKESQEDHVATRNTQPSVPSRYALHNKNARRSLQLRERRSNPTPLGFAPISAMTLTNLNAQEYWVAGLAWKIMALLYKADSDRVALAITTVDGTVNLGGSTILLGSAEMGTRVIRLYTDNIPNPDALVLVLLHEVSSQLTQLLLVWQCEPVDPHLHL